MAAYSFLYEYITICLNKPLLMNSWDVFSCLAIVKSSTLNILILYTLFIFDYFLKIYSCIWKYRVKDKNILNLIYFAQVPITKFTSF